MAGFLERLPGAAPTTHPFRLLADEADRWTEEVPRRWEGDSRPFERSLLDAALDVFRSVDRSASRLVNQDLHAWNVLRPSASRGSSSIRSRSSANGRSTASAHSGRGSRRRRRRRRWLDALADLGMDRERLRGWGLAHALAWDFHHGRWSTRSIEAARTISRA